MPRLSPARREACLLHRAESPRSGSPPVLPEQTTEVISTLHLAAEGNDGISWRPGHSVLEAGHGAMSCWARGLMDRVRCDQRNRNRGRGQGDDPAKQHRDGEHRISRTRITPAANRPNRASVTAPPINGRQLVAVQPSAVSVSIDIWNQPVGTACPRS